MAITSSLASAVVHKILYILRHNVKGNIHIIYSPGLQAEKPLRHNIYTEKKSYEATEKKSYKATF